MRNFFPVVSVGAALLAFAVLRAGGQEVASRSFTNQDGKVIEAVLLEVKGQNAQIRRVADGRNFEIPIGTLSLDDQIWIVDWIHQHTRAAAGEWAGLRVVFPNPMDACGVIGLDANSLRDKVGASEFDLLLPVGAWVSVSVYSSGGTTRPLEHLVQFRGAKRWEFSSEGMQLSLSRDGEPAEIVGVSFPATVTDEWLDSLDEKRFADQLSVELTPAADFDRIHWRKTRIAACTSDFLLEKATLDKIASLPPKAVDLVVASDTLDRLAGFPDLEAMSLQIAVRAQVEDGVRQKVAVDDLALPTLPAVRDLSLSGIPFTPELGAALAEKKILRMFQFSVPGESATYRDPAKWEGLGSLAKSLESLYVIRGIRFDIAELEKISGLRSIELAASNLDVEQFGSLDPSVFPELLNLQIHSPNIAPATWAEWAKHGALRKLRRLAAFQMFDVSRIPDLEMARFWGAGSAAVSPDLRDIQGAAKLRKLSFSGADQDDLAELVRLPIRDGIEALRLENSVFTDLSPLSDLPRLRLLELYRAAECPAEIDLGKFPNLAAFSASFLEKLETVGGAAAHPALRSLSVSSCDALRSLGQGAPNQVLRHLYVYRCQALETMSAFDQATGLTQMRLFDCDLLREPLTFLEKNTWNYLQVSGCENLEKASAKTVDR